MYENNEPILNNEHIEETVESSANETVNAKAESGEAGNGFVLVGEPTAPATEVQAAQMVEQHTTQPAQQAAAQTGVYSSVYASAEQTNNASNGCTQQPNQAGQGQYSSYTQQPNQAGQGQYSGYTQQNNYSAQGGQPYSAKDIQPRKKMGWGKRIAVLILCGLILGSSTAGAYFGVTYLVEKFTPAKGEQTAGTDLDVVEKIEKEPEISQAETIAPVQSGNVTVGVAYDVSPVVDNVMPAMVSIINNYTETVSSFFGQSYTQEGASSGSGIIIGETDTELLIATNYHVVEGSDSIEITFIDNTTANAYIKGTDPDMDLAVVSVTLDSLTAETKGSIAVASLGNSDELKLGQPVIAIGNALGYGQSVTTGVVSAIDRQISIEEGSTGSFIQTDAAINPGNSGGALLNMVGEVIGINSSKIGGSAIEGMGYAIPISAAEPIISDLSLQTTKIKVEEAERGYLGVEVADVTASNAQIYGMPQGVFIGRFTNDSAAQAGGMKVRDIIVGFDTFKISSYADLQEAMQYYAAGTTVTIEVMRVQDGEYISVLLEVTLGERPAQ